MESDQVRFTLVKQIAFFKEQYSAIRIDIQNFHLYSQLIERDYANISNDISRTRLTIKGRTLDMTRTKRAKHIGNNSLQNSRSSERKSLEVNNEIRLRKKELEGLVETRKKICLQKQDSLCQLSAIQSNRHSIRKDVAVLSRKLHQLQEEVRFQTAERQQRAQASANRFDSISFTSN